MAMHCFSFYQFYKETQEFYYYLYKHNDVSECYLVRVSSDYYEFMSPVHELQVKSCPESNIQILTWITVNFMYF